MNVLCDLQGAAAKQVIQALSLLIVRDYTAICWLEEDPTQNSQSGPQIFW